MTAPEVLFAVVLVAFAFTAGRVSLRRAKRRKGDDGEAFRAAFRREVDGASAQQTSETCAEVQERMLAQALATPKGPSLVTEYAEEAIRTRERQGLARYVEPVPVVLEPAAADDDAGQRDFLSSLAAFFRAAKAPTAPVKERVTLGRPREHVTAPPDWQAAVREIEGQPLPRDKGCIARQKQLEIERDLVARGLLAPHMAAGIDERARIDRALGFAAKRKEREQGDV